ncbi:MAG: putative glycolipid-binding domain-containing protein [Xylophilus ampelinus]
MRTFASILWRRLDAPGHDACRLLGGPEGWRLDGAAALRWPDGRPAALAYRVCCDAAWRSRRGTVRGWIGDRAVDVVLARDADGWRCGATPVPGLAHCIDLDLGFTPATNLLPLRRLALAAGASAAAPAAWLDLDARPMLGLLDQRYRRTGAFEYAYEAPGAVYAATLRTTAEGFVREYPGLWTSGPDGQGADGAHRG